MSPIVTFTSSGQFSDDIFFTVVIVNRIIMEHNTALIAISFNKNSVKLFLLQN